MSRLSMRLGVLVLVGLAAACEPGTEEAKREMISEPTDRSLIAFITQDKDDMTPVVAVMPSEGGEVTRLRPGRDPEWSPDGRRLVFGCDRGICTMDPDGTHLEILTDPGRETFDEEPAWGPTGQIAFTRTYLDGRRSRDVLLIAELGGKARPLITKGSNFSPAWSPDGRSIALIRGLGELLEAPNGGFQLWTMTVDGNNVHQLTDKGAGRPDWSPDGRSIVFDSGSVVWVVASKGGPIRNLTPATTGQVVEGLGSFASWSPDGERIAYMCSTGDLNDNDLCIMDRDGSGRTTILDTPANEGVPAWQPPPNRPTIE